ncbi:MAG: hypothetical protein MK135_05585 [Polyangiaceae bacterium]|nr:hypothetical protein [Polyangiaceae bacterium]
MSTGVKNLGIALACIAGFTGVAVAAGSSSMESAEEGWQRRLEVVTLTDQSQWPPPAQRKEASALVGAGVSVLTQESVEVAPNTSIALPPGEYVENQYGYTVTRRARASRIDFIDSDEFIVKLDDLVLVPLNDALAPITVDSFGVLKKLGATEYDIEVDEVDFDRYVRLPSVGSIVRVAGGSDAYDMQDIRSEQIEADGVLAGFLASIGLKFYPEFLKLTPAAPQEIEEEGEQDTEGGFLSFVEDLFGSDDEVLPSAKKLHTIETIYRIEEGPLAGKTLVELSTQVSGEDPIHQVRSLLITNLQKPVWRRIWPFEKRATKIAEQTEQ